MRLYKGAAPLCESASRLDEGAQRLRVGADEKIARNAYLAGI
jgi:hypothetical protein